MTAANRRAAPSRRDARDPEAFFEPGLLDRLRLQHGNVVDINAQALWVMDFARRKHVANPDGLLVSKVSEASKSARHHVPQTPAAREAEQERYAAFQIETFRLVSEQHLGPAAIAEFLEQARKGGLPLINARTIDRLRMLGAEWPEPPQQELLA